jgi:chitinase
MRFSSLDLDPFGCTHLVYAFATLDPHSFTIMPQDEEYDIVKGKKTVNLKMA